MRWLVPVVLLAACRGGEAPVAPPAVVDPLPSWNAGPAREALVQFVAAVTTEGPDYVDPEERIAVFDNDGTLWPEQPLYFQAVFTEDRIQALAPEHPEWATEEPFASVVKGDREAAAKSGLSGFVKLIGAVQGGFTVDEYQAAVASWMATAKHPRFDQPYTACAYQPMLEALAYLRANGFQTWIVSGGEQEFMRVFAEDVYGIPPQQVVGTRVKTNYEVRDGTPVLMQYGDIEFVDDGPGKPIGILRHIGRQPIAAFGNSDGDRQMLEWTASGPHRHFAALVHHTDETREWAYDRDSHIGHLEAALDQAGKDGWTVIDMKTDWNRVFPFDAAAP